MKAIFLNCTLKYPPEASHTDALIKKVAGYMEELGAQTQIERVLDYSIKFGISSDEGAGDEWPKLLEKILAADIVVVASPIWFGVRSSVAQMVMERLDGTYAEHTAKGQYPLYNKVAGVIVTGNEDGAHDVAANTLFNLSHLGCIVPPNADCYWVGEAGPGPSYMDSGGEHHLYTDRTARYMSHNLVSVAKIIAKNPIDTDLTQLDKEAQDFTSNQSGTRE